MIERNSTPQMTTIAPLSLIKPVEMTFILIFLFFRSSILSTFRVIFPVSVSPDYARKGLFQFRKSS